MGPFKQRLDPLEISRGALNGQPGSSLNPQICEGKGNEPGLDPTDLIRPDWI